MMTDIQRLFFVAMLSFAIDILPASAQQPASDAASLSDGWKQTLQAYNEWARVQQIYEPDQINDMRQKMLDKASHLPPEDSEKLRLETDAKLHVLMSAEANAARHWLANTLSVASDSYAARIRAKLPDVTKESAAQLQADLDAFANRETNLRQFQQTDEKSRQMMIKSIQENSRREAEARAQAQAAAQMQHNSYSQPQTNVIVTPGAFPRYRTPYGPTLPYAGARLGYRYW